MSHGVVEQMREDRLRPLLLRALCTHGRLRERQVGVHAWTRDTARRIKVGRPCHMRCTPPPTHTTTTKISISGRTAVGASPRHTRLLRPIIPKPFPLDHAPGLETRNRACPTQKQEKGRRFVGSCLDEAGGGGGGHPMLRVADARRFPSHGMGRPCPNFQTQQNARSPPLHPPHPPHTTLHPTPQLTRGDGTICSPPGLPRRDPRRCLPSSHPPHPNPHPTPRQKQHHAAPARGRRRARA